MPKAKSKSYCRIECVSLDSNVSSLFDSFSDMFWPQRQKNIKQFKSMYDKSLSLNILPKGLNNLGWKKIKFHLLYMFVLHIIVCHPEKSVESNYLFCMSRCHASLTNSLNPFHSVINWDEQFILWRWQSDVGFSHSSTLFPIKEDERIF